MSNRKSGNGRGVLRSEELNLLQQVFKRITTEAWFSPAPEDQQAFAAYIIKTYQRGMTDTEKLYAFCLAAARSRYKASTPPNDASACRTTLRQ